MLEGRENCTINIMVTSWLSFKKLVTSKACLKFRKSNQLTRVLCFCAKFSLNVCKNMHLATVQANEGLSLLKAFRHSFLTILFVEQDRHPYKNNSTIRFKMNFVIIYCKNYEVKPFQASVILRSSS